MYRRAGSRNKRASRYRSLCTANAIKYLWRWKLKNGEEDLQKAVWYINRLIQRAGADSDAGKELFNMKENKHGFEPKQEFTMGGIAWTVIQTGADWVKCIASDCVEERAFDEGTRTTLPLLPFAPI